MRRYALVAVVLILGAALALAHPGGAAETALLNVSYDPTRELWRDLNATFIAKYLKEANTKLEIKQSHGGSSTQARAVIDGLEADVVTLAMWSDTDAIRKKGLIAENWEQRLPHRRCPISPRSCSSSAKAIPRASRTGRIWCSRASPSSPPTPRPPATAS